MKIYTDIGISSQKEFDVYCNCLNKIEIGDRVEVRAVILPNGRQHLTMKKHPEQPYRSIIFPVVGVRKKTAKFYSPHSIRWIIIALPKEETVHFNFWERDAFNIELQDKFDLDSSYTKYDRLRTNLNFDYYINKVIKNI